MIENIIIKEIITLCKNNNNSLLSRKEKNNSIKKIREYTKHKISKTNWKNIKVQVIQAKIN